MSELTIVLVSLCSFTMGLCAAYCWDRFRKSRKEPVVRPTENKPLVVARMQRFRLTNADLNISNHIGDGEGLTDTWDYVTPPMVNIIIQRDDTFFVKAYNKLGIEYSQCALIKIQVRSRDGIERITIYGPAPYSNSRESLINYRMAFPDIMKSIILKGGEHLVIMTKDTVGMDAASLAKSEFQFLTSRIIEPPEQGGDDGPGR